MKKPNVINLISILLILGNINSLKAQDDYLQDNSFWMSVTTAMGSISGPFDYATICGDTLINNLEYKKAYVFVDSFHIAALDSLSDYPVIRPLRQDGQKIWELTENGEEELLYDYGLTVGDLFPIERKIYLAIDSFIIDTLDLFVESVSFEEVFGVDRKKIVLNPVDGWGQDVWYEGIGSNLGFFSRGNVISVTDVGRYVCCFKINDDIFYTAWGCDCTDGNFQQWDFQCSETTAVAPTIGEGFSVDLFPNPSQGNIIFNSTITNSLFIEIFSLDGLLLKTETITSGESLDLSHLANGIYFTKIKDLKSKQVQIERIIITY